MRTPLIAGNWKMYKTVADTVKHVTLLRALVKDIADVEIVIAPPFPSIRTAADALRGSNVLVAAQNLHWEREGAFTGEVSAPMIKEAGAELVIIGHSERRTLFGETDATVNRKIGAAFASDLTPIVCIGETLDQRERSETLDVLDRQIKAGLDGVTAAQLGRLVLAYEPVWAIGTGRNATPEQAGEAHHHIRAAAAPVVRRRGCRPLPRHLWRQRQAREHSGSGGAAGRRWGPGRRRQPRRAGLFRHSEERRPACIMNLSVFRRIPCCITLR